MPKKDAKPHGKPIQPQLPGPFTKWLEGSPHDGFDQGTDFVGGIGDSATFGATTALSDKIANAKWHEKAYLHPDSTAFKAGVAVETVAEIAAGGLPGALKHAAAHAIDKEAAKIATERGVNVVTTQIRKAAKKRLVDQARRSAQKLYLLIQKEVKDAGGNIVKQAHQVHHEIPLLGHPGGIPSLTLSLGLPRVIRDSRFTTRILKGAEKDGEAITASSQNALLHRGLRKQETAFLHYIYILIPAKVIRNVWKLGRQEEPKK